MSLLAMFACVYFREAIENFLSNDKDLNYRSKVKNIWHYKEIRVKHEFKDQISLFYYGDLFAENLSDVSEEQGERLHQDIKDIEEGNQARRNRNMKAGYYLCWTKGVKRLGVLGNQQLELVIY